MGYNDRNFRVEEVKTGGFVMSARKADHSDVFIEPEEAISETNEGVLAAFVKWLDGDDKPFEKKEDK